MSCISRALVCASRFNLSAHATDDVTLAKAFEEGIAEDLIAIIDPLLSDQDKYKQRAGGEFLAGLQRGDPFRALLGWV